MTFLKMAVILRSDQISVLNCIQYHIMTIFDQFEVLSIILTDKSHCNVKTVRRCDIAETTFNHKYFIKSLGGGPIVFYFKYAHY